MRQRRLGRGFTWLEFIILFFVLGIIVCVITPRFIQHPERQNLLHVHSDILKITEALERYNADNGRYPTLTQGLRALVKKPKSKPSPKHWHRGGYLRSVLRDPWGHPYVYLIPGVHGHFDLYSRGDPNS